ncbi:type II secretion system secretin GspD [Acidiphilium sp. C61]|jgi:general secretion pathway protein D|uniref:type II secretion system secretin GspD n=1 Tax=Acidiphilium sp. C61 TaxID=1671485 RepID=UPI00157A4F47|nr:type II secretion system secretin GspD [Acidiphilium sp. C61]
MRVRVHAGVIAAASLLAGCTPRPAPPDATRLLAPAPAAPAATTAPGRADAVIATPAVTGAITASPGHAPPASLPGAPLPAGSGDVSLDFADTDIRAVVAQILGNMLHVTYTIDPAVQGKATLRTAHDIPASALIPTLQTLLAQNHAALIRSNGLYQVVPADKAAAALATAPGLDGSSVVTLTHVSAAHLAAVLQPYVGKGGKVVAAPDRNALIVGGNPQVRATLLALIRAFDVDALAGQSYALYPASGANARDFATALTQALHAGKAGGLAKVVPLVRIGAVLVIAPSGAAIRAADRVYRTLARQEAATHRAWHVYYLRNSRAGDVAEVLQEAFTPDDVTAQPSAPDTTGGTAPGVSAQTLMGSGGLVGNAAGAGTSGTGTTAGLGATPGSGSGTASGLGAASPAASPAPSPASSRAAASNPLLGPLGGSAGGGGGGATSGLRIIADPRQNAILVRADASENASVEAMLRKLDIEPLEVEIDATIAEVDLNGALKYGTQFFFKSGGINAVLSTGATAALNQSFPGFVLAGHGADGAPLAISALQSVTQVQVLSSPQLLVQNGRTANLLVGNLVPYLSQTSQSTLTTGAPVINSVNYQETGVILQITPHISSDGLVALTVSQQVSNVAPSVTTQGLNSPTFSERAVSSSVVVHDGQTIGLAGLITDNVQRGNSGLPFLKDVPLLGPLFGTQDNNRARQELLVLITPHVVHDATDAAALTSDLEQALPNAANVPAELNGLPMDGSADPQAALRRHLGLH